MSKYLTKIAGLTLAGILSIYTSNNLSANQLAELENQRTIKFLIAACSDTKDEKALLITKNGLRYNVGLAPHQKYSGTTLVENGLIVDVKKIDDIVAKEKEVTMYHCHPDALAIPSGADTYNAIARIENAKKNNADIKLRIVSTGRFGPWVSEYAPSEKTYIDETKKRKGTIFLSGFMGSINIDDYNEKLTNTIFSEDKKQIIFEYVKNKDFNSLYERLSFDISKETGWIVKKVDIK